MNRDEAIVPSLHHRKEGWPSDSRNIAKHALIARPGWFSDKNNKEDHPGCVCFGGFALFFDDTATPPCGNARRGLSPDSDLFTASRTAATVRHSYSCVRLRVTERHCSRNSSSSTNPHSMS